MARTFRAMRNARFGSWAQVGQSADGARVGQAKPSSRQRRPVIAPNSVLARAMDFGASSLDVTEGRDADIATARAGGVLSATMSMAQMLLRPPNGRYRNVVIQPLAVGTAVPSRIWGGTLCDRH